MTIQMRKVCFHALTILVFGSFLFPQLASAQLGGIVPPPPPVVVPPAPTPAPVPAPVPTPAPPPPAVTPIITPPVVTPLPPPPPAQVIITPPSDTTPPLISGVAVASVSDIAATIIWTTDELAVSTLEYGMSQNYGTSATLDASALLVHSAIILGLSPSTTYYYCIHATDLVGNSSTSCPNTFVTDASVQTPMPPTPQVADTTAPLITQASSTVTSSSVTVAWSTDEAATSQVEYGTTVNYGSQTTLDISLGTAHSVTIAGFAADTEYHFHIKSADQAGNVAVSGDNSFTTAAVAQTSSGSSGGGSANTPIITPPVVTPLPPPVVVPPAPTPAPVPAPVPTPTPPPPAVTPTVPTTPTTSPIPLPIPTAPVPVAPLPLSSQPSGSNSPTNPTPPPTTPAIPTTPATPSITLPIISAVTESEVNPTTETISWVTDQPTDTQIAYGIGRSYGSLTTYSSSLVTVHSATLINLAPNTTYNYQIKSKDVSGNLAAASQEDFTTLSLPAPAPLISGVSNTVTTNSAVITWATNVPATSKIEYGLNAAYDNQTVLDTNLTLKHSQTISNLAPGITYDFRINSQNAFADLAISNNSIFTTVAVAVAAPPAEILPVVVNNLSVSDAGQTSVTISFTTPNNPTNTTLQDDIRYSTQPITSTNFFQATPVQTTPIYFDSSTTGANQQNQYVVLGLTPGTNYNFAIKTDDQSGNTSSISTVVSATTQTAASANSGSGSGGINTGGSTTTISAPSDLRAEAADSSVNIFWKNPSEANFIRVKLVRKAGNYPTAITDGQVLYEGANQNFVDTNLINGQNYYYAIFAMNHLSNVSTPVKFSVTPKAGITETVFLPATPIVSACVGTDLSFGTRNEQVKELQRFLSAIDQGIYPKKLVTGYFHKYTRAAILKLQAKMGLTQTGVWDQTTRTELGMCSGISVAR
ncbi:MAG TPA: fibronectin type III domain-containing protein [Patescibacteria group bacterium]